MESGGITPLHCLMNKSFLSPSCSNECWDDGILKEVSSHTFVGWLVGVGGPHPSKRQTLNIFQKNDSPMEVVDMQLCEVQRDIQVRKHSSSLFVSCRMGSKGSNGNSYRKGHS
jgi:hypothetical protein